jgi:hypothetical protein
MIKVLCLENTFFLGYVLLFKAYYYYFRKYESQARSLKSSNQLGLKSIEAKLSCSIYKSPLWSERVIYHMTEVKNISEM